MSLQKSKHVIWIRTGKTAGTSVDLALTELITIEPTPGWITEVQADKVGVWYGLEQFKSKFPDVWNDSFKFMVARNPYDRLVSAWMFFHPRANDSKLRSFIKSPKSVQVAYHTTLQQTAGLIRYNTLDIDFVVRFENLQESFDELCDVIDIPYITLRHLRKSIHKPFGEYYNAVLADTVFNMFEDDFKYLGYGKDSWL